jgi:hypothetical protein
VSSLVDLTGGDWEELSDTLTREALTEFLASYEPTDVVTLTGYTRQPNGLCWDGDLNGRQFYLLQEDPSDYAHDTHHDTYGNRSQRQLDLADMREEADY